MSFNVNTRLNNLQQQINAITNEGLTNPLQGILDVNGKGLTNVNIIDGGNNIIELKTNNVGGIVLDNPLYTTGDITVNTLHYTALDPPINYNSVTFRLIGSQTVEPTEGNINMYNDNPNSGFITYQSLQSPSLSCSLSLGAGNNIMYIGFSSSSTETTPTYGLYIFCAEGIIQNLTTQISVPLPALTFNLDLSIIGTTMKVFINGTEAVTMQSTIPNVSYYLNCNCYANIGTEIQAQNINYVVNKTENLSDVLAVGNNAGGQNITGVNALTCSQLNYTTLNPPIPTATTPTIAQVLTAGSLATNQDLSGINNLTCTTLKYTTLSPPIPTTPTPTIAQVLTAGSIGSNQDLSGINNLTCTTLKYTSLSPPIPTATIPTLTQVLTAGNGAGNLNITGVNNLFASDLIINDLVLNYGSAGSNFQIFGNSDDLIFQQYKGSPSVLTNQPIIITDSSSIVLNTGILALQNSYILDSKFNTPSYKRLINNQQFNISSFLNLWGTFFSTPLYPKTVNPTYENGLNYAELSMSNVEISLSTKITLSTSDLFNVFLSTSQTNAFDPTQGNCITQASTTGANKIVFISSATSILYFYSQTPITNLYLNIRITSATIQPLDIVYSYAKLSGMLTGSVCSNAGVLTFE